MADEASALLAAKRTAEPRLYELLSPVQRALIPALLLVSLALNIACLVPSTPFLELEVDRPIDQVIKPGNYGLGATLNILKERNIWTLYILILLFSICFPVRLLPCSPCWSSHVLMAHFPPAQSFICSCCPVVNRQPVKLIITAVLLTMRITSRTRGIFLAWLGHLGRWSLMDVYFAMLIIIIAWNQGLTLRAFGVTFVDAGIRTKPQVGLYLFHVAILCSMATVTTLQELNGTLTPSSRPSPPALPRCHLISAAGLPGAIALLLVCSALVLHVCAVALPAFTITGIKQASRPTLNTRLWPLSNFLLYITSA